MKKFLLGIDVGTTHLKAALFTTCFAQAACSTRDMITHTDRKKRFSYDPDEVIEKLIDMLKGFSPLLESGEILGVGVTSMAETGLLLDGSDKPLTPLLPWFDPSSASHANTIIDCWGAREMYHDRGIHATSKTAVSKLLQVKEESPELLDRAACWLSVADYLIYWLTGMRGTDYSLAVRTYALSMGRVEWDSPWLEELGLRAEIFPPLFQAGSPVGVITRAAAGITGLPAGIPVVPAGHDHVCGMFGAGAAEEGICFSSIGTADSITGTLKSRVTEPEAIESYFAAGVSLGLHVIPDKGIWMSGCNASGGSVDWMRTMLFGDSSRYEDLLDLVESAPERPSGILFFPYLNGRNGINRDPNAAASFWGLRMEHGRDDLARAVYEGTVYEILSILERAEKISGIAAESIIAAGGGTRIPVWMQIRTDIMNLPIEVPQIEEATLRGAAMLAALGAGVYRDIDTVAEAAKKEHAVRYEPNREAAPRYRAEGYEKYLRLLKRYEQGEL